MFVGFSVDFGGDHLSLTKPAPPPFFYLRFWPKQGGFAMFFNDAVVMFFNQSESLRDLLIMKKKRKQ